MPAVSAQTIPAATATSASDEELYLEVTVNQTRKASLYRFVQRDGHLFASPATLQELGFVPIDKSSKSGLVPVEHDGIIVSYDAGNQRVDIQAPLSQLVTGTTRAGAATNTAVTVAPSPRGLLLGYGFDALHSNGQTNASTAYDWRLFGLGRAVIEGNGIIQALHSNLGTQTRHVRLDTRLRWADPERALEVMLGDTLTRGPAWTRQIRLGGLRIGTNHPELQPGRITSPLPVFAGEVAVPSSVELYVNGVRQYAGDIPVGRFELSGLPSVDGRGNAQLRITDAFGRTRDVAMPFYSSRRLLAPGINDWSLAVGRVREGYGVRAFNYAPTPVITASWRRGWLDWLTSELHGEHGGTLDAAGAGLGLQLGPMGTLSAAVAESRTRGARGQQLALGYQWATGRFNFSLDSHRTRGDFRDLASLAGGLPPPRINDSANIGYTSHALGSFSLNYVQLTYSAQPRTRLAGLYWSRSLGSGGVFLSASTNWDLDRKDDRSVGLNMSMPLGPRQFGMSVKRANGRTMTTADLTQLARQIGDIGWHLQARAGAASGGLAEATWLTQAAQIDAGVAQDSGSQRMRLAASGSVVWLGGGLYASRRITDGFALVRTGIADVPILVENRVYGRTDQRGQLLVAPLFSLQANRISVDTSQLPADVFVPALQRTVVPRIGSGAIVDFGLQRMHPAVVILRDSEGHPLPMGSEVHVQGRDDPEPPIVGYDGEVYLEHLDRNNQLRVDSEAGACSVQFELDVNSQAIPRIGPLTCVLEKHP